LIGIFKSSPLVQNENLQVTNGSPSHQEIYDGTLLVGRKLVVSVQDCLREETQDLGFKLYHPSITVDQYSAVENARLAVEHDVAAKAAAGDPAALKVLEAMKKSGW
jgi:hypothetical protein